jgi:hypothetical protein
VERTQRAGSHSKARSAQADAIGEFEADVNNGGFSQFLLNKGRRRALATVGALRKIRAPKTAAMLRSALAHPTEAELLVKLDDRFYKVPEDLAVKTMESLGVNRGVKPATD